MTPGRGRRTRRSCRGREAARGQSLVEFSLGIGVFLMLLLGTVDLGRAAYQYNGVAEAAREIARAASVHPGNPTLGDSPEVDAVAATQIGLIPDLSVTGFSCVDLSGDSVTGTCHPGNWVRVTVTAHFQPVFPFLAVFGGTVMSSTSSAEIQ